MLSYKMKLLLALSVTISGWVGTSDWYQSATKKIYEGDLKGERLAILSKANNGVERKPGNRLIWQPSKSGSVFINGDTIRTTANGEGQVKLLESGTIILLEPESLIVIEKTEETISLDLLSGGLFIKSKGTNSKGKSPTIKAGKTIVTLGKNDSEINLNIGKDSKAKIAVTKGNIEVKTNGKKLNLSEGKAGIIDGGKIKEIKLIKTTSPAPNSISNLGPKGNKLTMFRWEPISKDFNVELKIGKSRSNLIRVSSTKTNGSRGSFSIKLKPGKFFWQLSAVNKKDPKITTNSLVHRIESISLVPAVQLTPLVSEEFFLTKKKVKVEFSWSVGDFADRSYLLVSKHPKFKNFVLKKNMKDNVDHEMKIKNHGTYYWKIVTFVEGQSKPLLSNVQTIIVHEKLNIKPPLLQYPQNKISIPISKAKTSGIFLEWAEVPGIEKYELAIKKKKKDEKIYTLETNQFRIKKITSGIFTWKVKSLGPANQTSKWSKNFKYKIVKTKNISWLSPNGELYRYNTKLPSIKLTWEKGSKRAKKWRIRYANLNDSLVDKEWKTISSPKIKIPLPEDGKFLFEVQALSKHNEILAIANKKTISIFPPPALSAPEFVNFDGKSKKASNAGNIKIRWEKVKGSSAYFIKITNKKTNESKTYKKKKNSIYLKNLAPGKYDVLLGTINNRDEMGDLGESKIISVPATSNIKAPSIDKIRVH